MDRATIKFEANGNHFEMIAVPTIHEDRRIDLIAASYASEGEDAQEQFQLLINTRDKYGRACTLKDEKGHDVEGNLPGTYKLDTNHEQYAVYFHFRNLVECCDFYGKFKVLAVKYPEGFNIDLVSTEEFMKMKSAFEVALKSFRFPNRAA